MKQMILTGLATEQTFRNKGLAQYFLVFNEGELKVPCTEEAAMVVAKAAYGKPEQRAAPAVEEEEEQPPQEDEEPNVQAFEADDDHGGDIVDADGVSQV